MNSEIIRISEKRVHEIAERAFISTCGLGSATSKKHLKMLEHGLKTRDSGMSGIDIRAIVGYYGPEVFDGGKIKIGEAELSCNYFSRIPREYVEGIYIYMLTAGECLFESEDKIMEFLFADIWGTSYVDAGTEALKEDYIIPDMKKRCKDKKIHLSKEFGPGYFGMFVGQTKEFEKILENEKIGVKVKDSGMMIPQKSCAGIYFCLNNKIADEPECAKCMGNPAGCNFCEIKKRMKENRDKNINIKFLPTNKTYEGKPLASVLECAAAVGVNIDGNCSGKGTCGKCKVLVERSDGRKEKLLACSSEPENGMTVTIPEAETTAQRKQKLVTLPQGFLPDKRKGYGISVDIGTTTVVVMLWSLENGEMVDINAFTNPQGVYGADVISRIQFTIEQETGLEKLHKSVIDSIRNEVEAFMSKHGIDESEIREYVVAGNTTMSHLFLGVSPRSLAVAPFSPAFKGTIQKTASDLGLSGGENCMVKLIPNIAGHVGSDITAGIITTDLMKKEKGHLFIDIGTNGEIVFSGNGVIACCSTAAGPAFEGSSVEKGMRAARGAIERVYIKDEGISIEVIGDAEPIGICGSGIIDCIGEMVRIGIIDRTGKLLSPEKLRKKGISENIISSITEEDGAYSLLLYRSDSGEEISISQKDVREVQLAKAAISAGIHTLMNFAGMKESEIEKISIAGAFGSYIRKESAINCGLIPKVSNDKIFSLGNSAGIGASMALLSEKAFDETVKISCEIEHIDLAMRDDFQDIYMTAMRF